MHSNVLPIFSLLAYSSRLILLRLLLLSLSSSSLSPSTPSPSYSSFYCVLFFALSFFFYLYSRSISLPLYSTLSLFGNTALLLALLFPIYASLLKCPSFFSSFFSLPHWSLSFSPSFFSWSSPTLHSLFPYSFVLFYVFYAPSPALSSSWVTFPLPFPSFPSNHPFFPPVLPFLTPSYHSFFSCPTCHLRPL